MVGIKYGGVDISRDFVGYFPEDINRKDNPADISCQQAAVSQPQRIFINKMSALAVTSILKLIINGKNMKKAFKKTEVLKQKRLVTMTLIVVGFIRESINKYLHTIFKLLVINMDGY